MNVKGPQDGSTATIVKAATVVTIETIVRIAIVEMTIETDRPVATMTVMGAADIDHQDPNVTAIETERTAIKIERGSYFS